MSERRDSRAPLSSRRAEERVEVTWAVDCECEDTFLYAYITNVSAMGVFVRTEHPLPIGTRVQLSFTPDNRPFEMSGVVAWINPLHSRGKNLNPGMGIRLIDLHPEERERLVALVRTIAYLREQEEVN